MKKRIAGAACALSALLLIGCGSKKEYAAGTYEGSGVGYNDQTPIKLSVTIAEDHSIYEIKVLEQQETETIGAKALETLCTAATEKNTAEVDTVSGATKTSAGFREALEDALGKAAAKK
uniref:FMN-binding protein n=1 Tax=Ndongobacter massiliensis TaxID=1871025 RepID=UPI00093140D4|nr:FMN-binding protein [Ndongobacter massiliensis]